MKRTLLIIVSTTTGLMSLLRLDPAFNSTKASPAALLTTPEATTAIPTTAEQPQASPSAVPSQTPSGQAPVSAKKVTAPAAKATAPSTTGTFTGDVKWNRYGPVQVRITVVDGKITTSEALQFPTDDSKSVRINELAIPWLNEQAIARQSANLDGVSGATYTTVGYEQSLASAIAKAGL